MDFGRPDDPGAAGWSGSVERRNLPALVLVGSAVEAGAR
jgi:hypothetical protein